MNELAKQGSKNVLDPLAGLRDYIIEDSATKTVFRFPDNTKFIASVEILHTNNYTRIKYGVNPISGTTRTVTCFKI